MLSGVPFAEVGNYDWYHSGDHLPRGKAVSFYSQFLMVVTRVWVWPRLCCIISIVLEWGKCESQYWRNILFLNVASLSSQCLLSASSVVGTRWHIVPIAAMVKLQHGQWWNIMWFEGQSWLGVSNGMFYGNGFDTKIIKKAQFFCMSWSSATALVSEIPKLRLSSETHYFLAKVQHSEIDLECKGSCFQYLKSVIVYPQNFD